MYQHIYYARELLFINKLYFLLVKVYCGIQIFIVRDTLHN